MESKIIMAKPVIGLDFGNYNSFTCYISDFDKGTKMGGIVRDLLPQGLNDGIPSVFFYSKNIGTLCGEDAVRNRAKPVQNRMRYLKRHLGEKLVLDDKTMSYDFAITEVIQHCVRRANEQLKAGYQVTTNLISLSYPATYTFAQRQRLIELAEKATLEDGTGIKVYGTIAEPAAAALDYLAEFAKSTEETTVLVYDLGGGTFDLALVSAYPAGRKNHEGNLYYYDIINTRGLAKVGGAEFDEILFHLLSQKFNVPLKPVHKNTLRTLAETVKIDLSSDTYAEPELVYNDDYLSAHVTREEFEAASRELLMKTIHATREILNDHPNQQPEFILLTGGASQMPMVQRELQAALPKFKGKIEFFRPSRAIAYGAARFGTSEANTDPVKKTSAVQQRTMYDIGVKFFKTRKDKKGYISTYIKAGTPIPHAAEYQRSSTLNEKQRYSRYRVYEANKAHPDTEKVSDDYKEIMYVEVDHGKEVAGESKCETRLVIDKLGLLTIEAREIDKPDKPPMKNTVELKNLS
jgi:molecular chaperone DnaK (HSP70)